MTANLMEYLPPVQQQSAQQHPASGAGKYVGQVAQGYDAKREQSPKWRREHEIIATGWTDASGKYTPGMLSDLPSGLGEDGQPNTIIFDCPVGTGRFLPFYVDKGFGFCGMDISPDMLRQAAAKLNGRQFYGELRQGDVRSTGLPDKCVDAAVCCRLTRWLSPADCQAMIGEMQRIACERIIWTARVANHPHARTVELFEAALDGWKIVRNEAGSDLDYRILQARPIEAA